MLREKRRPYYTSWGFLIRPQYTDAFQKVRNIQKDDRPKILGGKAYKEFIRWYRKGTPLGIKITRTNPLICDTATYWSIAYSGRFYVTVSLDENAVGHICTLYYYNQDKTSFALAVGYLELKNFYMKKQIISKLPYLEWKTTSEMLNLEIPK